MSASRSVGAPRQAVILATILGFHVGAGLLVMDGFHPRLKWLKPAPPHIYYELPKAQSPVPVAPQRPGPVDYGLPELPDPAVPIPDFRSFAAPPDEPRSGAGPAPGSGPDMPPPDSHGPSLRMRDNRLAALIDACYPSASRRLAEEGRVVVHVRVDAAGRAAAWNLVERSGFARLDAAAGCVVRRLEFVPGRHDGTAVEASARLPIVFRLD
jgi:periplasmic protein TonB